jgi:ribonuclease BN (tRNA processing enzyme)
MSNRALSILAAVVIWSSCISAATYGYRFDTLDRVIVISGDTRPSPELVKACRRCGKVVIGHDLEVY